MNIRPSRQKVDEINNQSSLKQSISVKSTQQTAGFVNGTCTLCIACLLEVVAKY